MASSRNDPERLEAEAKELYEQMTKGKEGTPEVDQPLEDTPEEPEELQVEAPNPRNRLKTPAKETLETDCKRGEKKWEGGMP